MAQAATIELAQYIRPGDTVTFGQADAHPRTLLRALAAQRHQIGRTRLFLGIGQGLETILQPEYADAFDYLAYCGSGSNRALAQAGVLDIVTDNYSALPGLLSRGALRVDVVLLQVSPPDEQGRYSLGMAREYLVPALEGARAILAEVCPCVPWTHGGPYLRESDIDLLIQTQDDDPGTDAREPGPIEQAIGRNVASIVPDGATLQTGIGAIPDAVLAALAGHRDLGLHSGSLGEGIIGLAESGALTNARKGVDTGLTIGGVLIGGPRLRRFAHRNPRLALRSTAYTHDARVLAGLNRFTAINSAVEVDLTGQVNSEAAGGAYVGAVGGVVDFLRGAHASKNGVPIIALPSMARGQSRVVASLSGPVTVPRSCSCVIVTEHGIADLRGLTLSQRIDRMLGVAHPEQRDALEREIAAQRPLGWKIR
ncbi:acetyl-CoA hydrolase/transferase family protein [Verticiella sediminum]|uniref:Acetyl-CoA hydrolase/transferase family protein n=1 Tax=Verticiella sediminum TaxID=1247510 RepID=A0A556AEE4_9BURK|nr:acetyl-CoA hydrolase/transferase C-terminal domain-containing protein [Verticiella sediminum]TSH91233.1 acetyl-CoA hydrolase/transferase family protein [Verticiella sediminum]